MEGNYFLMEDSRSFTLDAKHGRKLLPRGRPQLFYLETGSQIWKGINLLMENDSCPLYNLLQHHTKRQP